MVLDIFQWTYRKYKAYCFIAFILLAVSLLGYTALIVYWLQNLMQASKMRKKHPAIPVPEELTASPSRVRTTQPDDMTLEDQPAQIPRILPPKPDRRHGGLKDEENRLTPSPLHKRSSSGGGRRRRRRRIFSRVSSVDDTQFAKKKWSVSRRRLRLQPPGTASPHPPEGRGVSGLLKEEEPSHKQYLFL